MTSSKLYVGSDMILRLDGLSDNAGTYVNDATVTLESLEDETGTAVSGVSTPLTMDYIGGSSGRYEATIPDTASTTAGRTYTGTIKAVYSGVVGQWTETMIAEKRAN